MIVQSVFYHIKDQSTSQYQGCKILMGGTGMAVINRWQKDVKMKMMQRKVWGKKKMAQQSHNPSVNARDVWVWMKIKKFIKVKSHSVG